MMRTHPTQVRSDWTIFLTCMKELQQGWSAWPNGYLSNKFTKVIFIDNMISDEKEYDKIGLKLFLKY